MPVVSIQVTSAGIREVNGTPIRSSDIRKKSRIGISAGSRKMYERYTVKVERLDKKDRVIASKSYIFDESTLKLKLEKNSKYRITITPEFIGFYRNMMDRKYYINHLTYNPYGLKYPQGNEVTRFASLVAVGKWKPLGWSTHSTWKVTSTKGISECAFNR